MQEKTHMWYFFWLHPHRTQWLFFNRLVFFLLNKSKFVRVVSFSFYHYLWPIALLLVKAPFCVPGKCVWNVIYFFSNSIKRYIRKIVNHWFWLYYKNMHELIFCYFKICDTYITSQRVKSNKSFAWEKSMTKTEKQHNKNEFEKNDAKNSNCNVSQIKKKTVVS